MTRADHKENQFIGQIIGSVSYISFQSQEDWGITKNPVKDSIVVGVGDLA